MLHLQYRPKTWDGYVGNEKTVDKIKRKISSPNFRNNAFWISGPTGVGKTTLANIVALQLADDFDIQDLDGDKCTVDAVRDLEKTIKTAPMYGEWKVVIVNEAHAMTSKAVQAWLTLLENLPDYRLVIFTTTETRADLFGEFTGPMLSRCVPYELKADRQAFASRARFIAEQEGLHTDSVDYDRLMDEVGGSLRFAIGRIENETLPDSSVVVKPRKLSAIEEMRQKYKIA